MTVDSESGMVSESYAIAGAKVGPMFYIYEIAVMIKASTSHETS